MDPIKTYTHSELFNYIEVQLCQMKDHRFNSTRSYIRLTIIFLFFSENYFGDVLLHALLVRMVEEHDIKINNKKITNPASKFIRALKLMEKMGLLVRIEQGSWKRTFKFKKNSDLEDEELLEFHLRQVDPSFVNNGSALGKNTCPGIRKIKEWFHKYFKVI